MGYNSQCSAFLPLPSSGKRCCLVAPSCGFHPLIAPSPQSPRDQLELHPNTAVVLLGEGCPQEQSGMGSKLLKAACLRDSSSHTFPCFCTVFPFTRSAKAPPAALRMGRWKEKVLTKTMRARRPRTSSQICRWLWIKAAQCCVGTEHRQGLSSTGHHLCLGHHCQFLGFLVFFAFLYLPL